MADDQIHPNDADPAGARRVRSAKPERLTSLVKHGATDGAHDGLQAASRVGRLLSRSIYGTCYYAAFGVAYGALTVGRWIPKDNVVVHGIQDGTNAAREATACRGSAAASDTNDLAAS